MTNLLLTPTLASLHGGLPPEFIKMLIYIIGFLVAVFAGMLFVQEVLKLIPTPLAKKGGNAKGAGRLIGIFERAIIISLIFAEAYSAVGLVLAAKSIARFERLKKRDFAEYYLIGTLASISFGIIVGLLTLAVARVV